MLKSLGYLMAGLMMGASNAILIRGVQGPDSADIVVATIGILAAFFIFATTLMYREE